LGSCTRKETKLQLIPAFGISFPLSNYATQTGSAIGQRATQLQPKFVVHYKTRFGMFYTAQVGYNYALSPVPSSFNASFKVAFSTSKLYTDIWFDYQKGEGDLQWIGGISQDFRTLPVTYTRVGGVMYYGIKPQIGAFINGSYILNGMNIGKAYTIGAGLVYKMKFVKKGCQINYEPEFEN